MASIWTSRYAGRSRQLRSSAIRDLLHLLQEPDMISFAGGLPAPETIPIGAIQEATQRVLALEGSKALQYSTTEGYLPLRALIARHFARYGIAVRPSNILITSGSQQALDLIGKLFLDPGDVVVVEEPTYLGALQAFRAYEPRFVSVPMDDEGVRLEPLEQALVRDKPKLLYLLPNFQNPSGVSMSELRRQQVMEMAARHDVPVVEDDPYGQLRYTGWHQTPLLVLDGDLAPQGHSDDPVRGPHVLYTSTFSKLLAPGLRIGWVLAPEEVIASLVLLKQGTDLHTSTFAQMLAYDVCRGGFLDRHVVYLRSVYSERLQAMLEALEDSMPEGVTWTRPVGGLFLWVKLPAEMDSKEVLRVALEKRVAFVPGAAFHASGGGRNTLRLNFSYCSPGQIATGIRRLAAAVRECQARELSKIG